MNTFTIKDQFYLNGEPFRIISGAIHYFRVPRAYWRDRLEKLRAMGCNTVETYVPWNLHEPKPGEYRFEGDLDIAAFLKTAQEVGLYAIVRPSPYICAEWEFGGLPAWLLAGEDIPIRSSEGPFLSYVERYYQHLFPQLVPMQIENGGPVILMQVENEFGAWGKPDPAYMQLLAGLMRKYGATAPFSTSDNFENNSLERGTMDGALATANFGSGAVEKLNVLRGYTKCGPLMVGEFWVGWFDAWGDDVHHTTDAAQSAAELDAILERGSVNIYMFHGGTNFCFMNGANDYDKLTPDVTSYDYDSPLSEDGQITPKYEAFRNVIARHAPIPEVSFRTDIRQAAYGALCCDGVCSLFDALDVLSTAHSSSEPRSMERFGQGYGYILYRTMLPTAMEVSSIELTKAADRAQIFIDGVPALTLYDRELSGAHAVKWSLPQGAQLDILVENLGRVNYSQKMMQQRKGIDGAVLLDGQALQNWQIWTLPLESGALKQIGFSPLSACRQPAFYHFALDVQQKGDTFLDLSGWGKGCVFLNGFNLGRFWNVGPQQRLYIPAPLLKDGVNDLVVFETEGFSANTVCFHDKPELRL